MRDGTQEISGQLECEVSNGMFKGEKLISFEFEGRLISASVSAESISGNLLKVDIYEEKKGQVLIGIPGESFSSTRKIWIPKEILK
jgi:hypothetical protein